MDYQNIIYEVSGHVAVIRLNRPHRMNAVIEGMYQELLSVIEKSGQDPAVRCLILTGSVRVKDGVEKQAFCAGADLKEHAKGERTQADKRSYILLGQEVCRAFYRFPKPTIAAVNGPARGAGAEMALNCDFVFMADTASLAFTEASLSTFIGGGVTMNLPRLIGLQKAKEMVYSCKVLNGAQAAEIGLALRHYPIKKLLPAAMDFALELAAMAPISLALAKERLQQPAALDYETVLALEADAVFACMASEDWHEGVRSFAEGRPPVFKGK